MGSDKTFQEGERQSPSRESRRIQPVLIPYWAEFTRYLSAVCADSISFSDREGPLLSRNHEHRLVSGETGVRSSGRNFREHGVKQPSLPGRRLAVAHYFRDLGQAAVNRESRRIQQLLVLYKTNLSSRGMSLQQATAKSLVLPLKSEFSSKAKQSCRESAVDHSLLSAKIILPLKSGFRSKAGRARGSLS